jgi:PAS domain S-box-containing protein
MIPRAAPGADLPALKAELRRIRSDLKRGFQERDAARRTLHDLRESAARWRSVIENPHDFVVVIDREGRYLFVNHTATGIRMQDLIGTATLYDYAAAEFHAEIRRALSQVFETGKPAAWESFSPQVDAWFSCVVSPIQDAGRVVAATVMARDVSKRVRTELELRDSEERFRQLAEHIEDVFYLLEVDSRRALYVSPTFSALYGLPASQLYMNSMSWLDAVHPEDREVQQERFREMFTACAGTVESYHFGQPHEYRVLRPDASLRWVRARNFPVHGSGGRIERIAGIVTDITGLREANQRLAEAESKYRLLVEKLPVISYIGRVDEPRTTLYVSPQIESKLGYTQAEWTADPGLWIESIHPDDRDRVCDEKRRLRESGEPTRTLYRLIARNGTLISCRDEAVLVRDEAGGQWVEGVIVDVSEAEEARALSAYLVAVQESERRRIARELHDDLGQMLTGLNFALQMIAETAGGARGAVAEARGLVGDLMNRVRELSHELRPSMLDDLGLLPTLNSMFARYTKQTQVQVHFEHRGIDARLAPEVEITAYRVLQEALTNVARHAQVREVRVQLWSDGAMLHLQIHDAGPGFDVASTLVDGSGSGLLGMRERVSLLDGEMTLQSDAEGTRITVHLPLPRKLGAAEPGTAA